MQPVLASLRFVEAQVVADWCSETTPGLEEEKMA